MNRESIMSTMMLLAIIIITLLWSMYESYMQDCKENRHMAMMKNMPAKA